MNRVGIMVDISHVSDSTFWQVMELSSAPCIASHSSARKFTPGFERNMNDEMIKALAQHGGVIQINFGSTFLDGKVAAQRDSLRSALTAILEKNDLSFRDEAAKPVIEQFQQDNPALFADVKTVADHIDHVVQLSGIDHVAFGSDFDGVGDSLPTGLKDVSMYPNLIQELLSRNYTEEEIARMCYGNVFRVWRQVALVAEAAQ
jgi:membrane dipeptidase